MIVGIEMNPENFTKQKEKVSLSFFFHCNAFKIPMSSLQIESVNKTNM